MGYIYKIINLINNKVYIGQTRGKISIRFNNHMSAAFNKNLKDYDLYFYRAIRKYGKENFVVDIIEEIDNSLLDNREIYWINEYNSTDRNIGYNLTSGGGGHKNPNIDDELINKLWDKGYSHTEISYLLNIKLETVSLHLKNNPSHTKEEIKRRRYEKTFAKTRRFSIDQYDLNGKFIKHYNNSSEASKENTKL